MKEFLLETEVWLPRSRGEVFSFFADAHNLETITPPWLNFRILPPVPEPIAAGTETRYRIRWHGLPIRWTTQIRQWAAPERFIDVQRRGPYKFWHHTHRFESHGGRTRMTDVVRYALPFGILGRLVHAAKVRGDVWRIFAWRRRRIIELFGS